MTENAPPNAFIGSAALPHSGTDTSAAAADSMKRKALLLRERVLESIGARHSEGATCDQIEIALGLTHQTCSARFNELAKAGAIVDSGNRRPTRSGRKAIVYVVRETGCGSPSGSSSA
jgi:hypothetical protein